MKKNDKLFKKIIKIGVSAMIGLILLVKVSRLIIIFSGDMPAMDDIYFLAYDSRTRETIIYRYDADMKKTNVFIIVKLTVRPSISQEYAIFGLQKNMMIPNQNLSQVLYDTHWRMDH